MQNVSSEGNQASRIRSIDLLRGLVIVIMALDHVRDFWSLTAFWPEDLAQTTPALFFTRWITHFCAPVFLFLSGVSAYLYGSKPSIDRAALSRFLVTRGLWLIFVELTLVNFSWTFSVSTLILGVIWAIGWSMLVLSVLVYLPLRWIIVFAVVTMIGQHLLDSIHVTDFMHWGWLWAWFHEQAFFDVSMGPLKLVVVGYPILPWIGVMALGYACGAWFQLPVQERHRHFVRLGLAMVMMFLVLRGINAYGNPMPWVQDERGLLWGLMSFLNTQKYPPSLSYLLMTLGPAILLIPVLEQWQGRSAEVIGHFGKVPFFFYILHLPFIHLAALLWQLWAFGQSISGFLRVSDWPVGYEPSLIRTYVVWVVAVFILYWPCRWFVGVRQRYQYWWLSYL